MPDAANKNPKCCRATVQNAGDKYRNQKRLGRRDEEQDGVDQHGGGNRRFFLNHCQHFPHSGPGSRRRGRRHRRRSRSGGSNKRERITAQIAAAIQGEIARQTSHGRHCASQRRTRDRGRIERQGLQRNGVNQVFRWRQQRQQRGARRLIEAQQCAGSESEHDHHPQPNRAGRRQSRQREGRQHQQRLCAEQKPPLVVPVGECPAEGSEEEEGGGLRERHRPQRHSRVSGDPQHQQALGDNLHPGAQRRSQHADPQNAVVPVAKGPKRPESLAAYLGRARGGCAALEPMIISKRIGNIAVYLTLEEPEHMTWQTPKIEEISCSCEINSYSNGDF